MQYARLNTRDDVTGVRHKLRHRSTPLQFLFDKSLEFYKFCGRTFTINMYISTQFNFLSVVLYVKTRIYLYFMAKTSYLILPLSNTVTPLRNGVDNFRNGVLVMVRTNRLTKSIFSPCCLNNTLNDCIYE